MSIAIEEVNPFEEMQKAAERKTFEDKAAALVADVRQAMVLGKPANRAAYAFFTTLLLKLDMKPAWWVPTAATDGKRILYNPEFFSGMTKEQCMGVCVHEILHCANQHHLRRGDREPERANIAMDLAINPLITEAGFQLPKGALFPGQAPFDQLPVGLSFEEYYPLIPENFKGKGKGKNGDPGGCGTVMEPGDGQESDMAQSQADWEVAVAQARNAAQRTQGTMPGGLSRMIDKMLEPKVDWKEVLREFVTRNAKNEFRWTPPNRRFVGQGLYLPGLKGESLEGVYIAVDTSGSIGQDEMDRFAAEIDGIIGARAMSLTILFHDSVVAHVQKWESTDGPLKLEPAGGGGTDHRPVFEKMAEYDDVACLVCFTDLYSTFPSEAPGYPVLWISTVKDHTGPFGKTVYMGPE